MPPLVTPDASIDTPHTVAESTEDRDRRGALPASVAHGAQPPRSQWAQGQLVGGGVAGKPEEEEEEVSVHLFTLSLSLVPAVPVLFPPCSRQQLGATAPPNMLSALNKLTMTDLVPVCSRHFLHTSQPEIVMRCQLPAGVGALEPARPRRSARNFPPPPPQAAPARQRPAQGRALGGMETVQALSLCAPSGAPRRRRPCAGAPGSRPRSASWPHAGR